MVVPTIDPGEMMYWEGTRQEGFDSTKVNAIQLNENKKESDKNSEGNSLEKMLKKNNQKICSRRE